jgi:hypothetical protein
VEAPGAGLDALEPDDLAGRPSPAGHLGAEATGGADLTRRVPEVCNLPYIEERALFAALGFDNSEVAVMPYAGAAAGG